LMITIIQLSVRGNRFFNSSDYSAEAMPIFQCFNCCSMSFLVPLQKIIRLHD
jgi:hypothetical protein